MGRIIKRLIIIYIEGIHKTIPKQEKHLFLSTESNRFWHHLFTKEMDYEKHLFIIVPKVYESNHDKDKAQKIRQEEYRKMFAKEYFHKNDESIIIDLIITGDND